MRQKVEIITRICALICAFALFQPCVAQAIAFERIPSVLVSGQRYTIRSDTSVKFTSSTKRVIKSSSSGVLLAGRTGVSTIAVKTRGGETAQFDVAVLSPTIHSARCDADNPSGGAELSYTVVTNTDAYLLKAMDEKADMLAEWNAGYSDSGNTRTWSVRLKLSNTRPMRLRFIAGAHSDCDDGVSRAVYTGKIATIKIAPTPPEYPYTAKSQFSGDLSRIFGGDWQFAYQIPNTQSRVIVIEPKWVEKHIEKAKFLSFTHYVAREVADKYAQVEYALRNTDVVVQYADGSSRRFALSSLVYTLSGTYSPRFIKRSSGAYSPNATLSQHAWGIATDINAGMEVNKEIASNWSLIGREIPKLKRISTDKNGNTTIITLSYDGDVPASRPLPDALINYTLYELAFAPAGFYWGGYFSNIDAMHFSLTEKGARSPSGTLR